MVRGPGGKVREPPHPTPRSPTLPFAWSLSSWLADFFQSSMRSCSGLMRLSSNALREKAVGEA